MMRWVRRLFWLSVLVGGGYAAYVVSTRRKTLPPDVAPWAPTPAKEPVTDVPPAAGPRWVAPIDGVCPAGYPIKAGANSEIYHVPGGRFYERTAASRGY